MVKSSKVKPNQAHLDAFTAWLATPPDLRQPKTQKELAIKLGVDEPQLSHWKKDLKKFIAEPTEIARAKKRIFDLAMEGKNPGYTRLWAEMTGQLRPDRQQEEVRLTADDYFRLDQQCDKELAEFRQDLVSTQGVEEVQEILSLLHDKIRKATG